MYEIGCLYSIIFRKEATILDFYNHHLWPITIGGYEFWITTTIRNTWIIMGVLILFAIIIRWSISKFENIPKGFQNIVEAIVEIFIILRPVPWAKRIKDLPLLWNDFSFILFSNLSGLFGLRAPTADLATTLGLALITFFMVQYFGIRSKGIKGYMKGFFDPVPVFFPINLIGEIANPISLSFRLFGNILAGTMIMTLYYSIPFWPVKIVIPVALHGYFDVFSGVLQTFIFVMLSMTFVSGAIEE